MIILSNSGFWLIGAGAVTVAFGFIGLAFSRNREQLAEDGGENGQVYPALADLPKSAFGQRTREDSPNARPKASNTAMNPLQNAGLKG